jgi:thymidylate kinase
MKKALKIISIDGTRGSGKTNQINMLARHFKTVGLVPSIVKIETTPDSGLPNLQLIDEFLTKNSNGIVIMDGSIARPMVSDLIDGIASTKVIDRYKHSTHDYEKIDKKYGVAGILFVMDNLEEANNRLKKRNSMATPEGTSIDSLDRERDIVSGMRTFNNHIASKNIEFHTFNIEPTDSMLSIHREVLSYLSDNFNIPIVKKDENEW